VKVIENLETLVSLIVNLIALNEIRKALRKKKRKAKKKKR
jgi:hypothetical protein